MMRRLAVMAILAFCLANAEYYTERTADKDFLAKQKKIYNLLYHVSQPDIVTPNLQSEALAFDLEKETDLFTDKEVLLDFIHHYKHGFLPRGEVFSVYYPKLLDQAIGLFKLFYYAKDFDSFYKVAVWARVHVNEYQYVYALYQAVIRRPDTKYIRLPPLYEMFPYGFFNAEVIEKAHHAKIFGKLDSKKSVGGYDTYIIPANYSGWYINQDYDYEHKLNYFTEDIGLNTYYFFFRNEFPFWLKGEEYGFPNYRGEEYLYGHKQILSRYYLERLANGLGKFGDFDWHREFRVGYYPTMTYPNGLPFPHRANWNLIPQYKFKYISAIINMEHRISAAIDTGYVFGPEGKKINIYTPEGLNILGNLIEGNLDSCDKDFYGSIDTFGRKILGFNLEPSSPYQVWPSALEHFSTCMRDPAFYRLYKRIYDFYYSYKKHMKPYNKEEVEFSGLKIESFAVDKLVTFFDQFDATISNGLVVEDQKEAETFLIKARQYRLNHKPFTFHIGVNSELATKAVIRIFLGPKYDEHHKLYDFTDSYRFFYEMDNFIVDLNAGSNKIERHSTDCYFTIPDPEPSEVFYKKVEKALDSGEPLKYQERIYGFPERLLLPKGTQEGMPFQFFIHVSPLVSEVPYTSRVFGDYKFDNRAFGYPLDRPVYHYYFDGPNMLFKDVFIFHKDESELNVTY